MALPDIGERLGLSPKVFRSILTTYSDILPVVEADGERLMSLEDVEKLEFIKKAVEQGFSEDEVRDRLARHEGVEPALPAKEDITPPGDDPAEESPQIHPNSPELLSLLYEMKERLDQIETRIVEERDKTTLALIRLQKEVQHLRYELVGQGSRRDRKKGFWSRLEGR